MHFVNGLINSINKFFTIPYCFILYSEGIRELFNIKSIFDKTNIEKNKEEEMELSSDPKNSNKSILENLLN